MPEHPDTPSHPDTPRRNFIEQIIDADIAAGKWGPPGDATVIRTRFPPEPNGYLHIGHPKAIHLSHGLAREFGGTFILRFDDTNPAAEEKAFVDSIQHDIDWLGAHWDGPVRFASDYFEQLHAWAVELIRKGLAYVDDQSAEQIRATRGTATEPGVASPFRDRPIDENLDLFERMRRGEFADGSRVLRAKIDMSASNFNLRDPVMYRIVNATHHRTGDAWHIYPMYDWAHGLEDSIEGITHSLCTLEFEDHRPLYDWFIDAINRDRGPDSQFGEPIHHPQQIEFARLEPTFVVTSKRKLKQLVDEGRVAGWDDPRMPTVSGLRRRGFTPESIRSFCGAVGVTKFKGVHDIGLLDNAVREHLNRVAPRRMCVLRPLKVTITNWADGGDPDRVELLDAINNPEDASAGTRKVPFSGSLLIERDDFMEDAPRKFFRLKPGGEVRLRYGYWITCNEVIKDDAGAVVELRCTYDPLTRGGDAPPPDADGMVRKVKGTIHWVSAPHAVGCTVRLVDRLFTTQQPGKRTGDVLDDLNPESLVELTECWIEPNWAVPGDCAWPDRIERFQFERLGYFCLDQDATPEALVFNRTVPLRDSWAKKAASKEPR